MQKSKNKLMLITPKELQIKINSNFHMVLSKNSKDFILYASQWNWSWVIFNSFYFSACGAQLDNFASKLENFQSLSNLATRQEIGRNLYLNYIFARYVTSETAEEQLWWLFDDLDGQKGRNLHWKFGQQVPSFGSILA